MADWNSLLSELVRVIADKLENVEDFTMLAAVCRSFRSAAMKDQWRPDKVCQPPWLLLCCQDNDGNDCGDNNPPMNDRSFLSMYKDKRRFYMNLPEICGRRCFGTPYGWLVTVGPDGQLHLFNPLNRRRIALPESPSDMTGTFHDEKHKKNWIRRRLRDRAILIKRPPNSYSSSVYDDFLVVTITCYGYVTVVRPHTNCWDSLYYSSGKLVEHILDIISYQGQIYGVGVAGRLVLCSNLDGPDTPVGEQYVGHDYSQFDGTEKLYLVELRGELALIARDIEYHPPVKEGWYITKWFDVYKLNHKSKKWIKIEDLEDQALFVGDCQAVALSSAESVNCRSNCIYYSDDNYEQFKPPNRGGHDMGIFDFKEETIQTFYDGADSLSFYSTPTWFIPTFT